MRLALWNAATLHCPLLPLHFLCTFVYFHFLLSLSSSSPLTSNTLVCLYINSFMFFPLCLSLSCMNTCSYIHPYLVLFVKQNLFQWDGNQVKGNHAVIVQLLIVPPPSLLTVSPKQGRCSVCMLPAFSTSIFLPGIPDYCSICLIVVSECLLFVQCDVLEVSASIQNVPG